MKNFKVLYLLLAATFLISFFACGVKSDTSTIDAEKYIDERMSVIASNPAVLEAEIGDENVFEGISESSLELSACVTDDVVYATDRRINDCIPQIIIVEPDPLTDQEQCVLDGGEWITKVTYYECEPAVATTQALNRLDDSSTSTTTLCPKTIAYCDMPEVVEEEVIGDMNGDGSFNIGDITFLIHILTNRGTASLEVLRKGDVNKGDKVLNGIDLAVMIHYAFKDLSEFPVEPAIKSGDVNFDGSLDISDLTTMIAYVYQGAALDSNAIIAGDINLDMQLDAVDIDLLIDYMFIGNPVTALPYTILSEFSLEDPIVITPIDPCIGIEEGEILEGMSKLADMCM